MPPAHACQSCGSKLLSGSFNTVISRFFFFFLSFAFVLYALVLTASWRARMKIDLPKEKLTTSRLVQDNSKSIKGMEQEASPRSPTCMYRKRDDLPSLFQREKRTTSVKTREGGRKIAHFSEGTKQGGIEQIQGTEEPQKAPKMVFLWLETEGKTRVST